MQTSGPVKAVTWLAGRRLSHRPGARSLGIIPAGADSAAITYGSIEGIAVRISAECFALAAAYEGRHGAVPVETLAGRDDTLYELGNRLVREAASVRRDGPLYWSSLSDALIRRLASRHTPAPAASATPRREALDPSTLKRLDAYIRAEIASPLDLNALAAAAGCERFRFARGFRTATGLTPHRYVTRIRIERARTLLRAGHLSPAEVALATGFYDQSHMTNWLKRVHGVTPAGIARQASR